MNEYLFNLLLSYRVNILLCGQSKSGKTTLINRKMNSVNIDKYLVIGMSVNKESRTNKV